MKKSLIIFICGFIILLSACGKVSKEKLNEVVSLYENISDKYTVTADDLIAAGDDELAENYAELGNEISRFGNIIANKTDSMKEEELDKLLEDLQELERQLDETAGVLADAAAGGYILEYTVKNNMKVDIAEITMSPSGLNKWSKNLLNNKKILKAGEIGKVKTVYGNTDLTEWDLKFITNSGDEILKNAVNIKSLSDNVFILSE